MGAGKWLDPFSTSAGRGIKEEKAPARLPKLPLPPGAEVAIVPPSLADGEQDCRTGTSGAPLSAGARWLLVGAAVGLTVVFAVARWIEPYDTAGRPLRAGAHEQLGLPPCTFYTLTRRPCPSCGMTTSFALFVRGDLPASARANVVGTLLAAACLLIMPGALACAALGRWPLPWRPGPMLSWLLFAFAALLLARWAWVLAAAPTPPLF